MEKCVLLNLYPIPRFDKNHKGLYENMLVARATDS